MSLPIDLIQSTINGFLPEMLSFLEDLVGINSFTANALGVNQNATRIIHQFAPFGFQASQTPCSNPGTGSHLVLDSGGTGSVIACISHLDTVYSPEEEVAHHFHWLPEGSRIFGPGTVDIKGGTALLWLVLQVLRTLDPQAFHQTRWILLWNASEETLSADFARLCYATLPETTKACLIFEGDGRSEKTFAVVRSRKGRGVFNVQVSGRGAHAGGKHAEGANAIRQAARLVERISAFADDPTETTINVGTIQGGTVVNRVPHQAQFELELRSPDPVRYAAIRQAILHLAGPGDVIATSDGFPCQIDIQITTEADPWAINPQTDALIDHWKKTALQAGLNLEADNRGGLSDGNYLWNRYPTLDGLGPRGNHAHSSERSVDGTKLPEYVDVTSFLPKALLNVLAIHPLLNLNHS